MNRRREFLSPVVSQPKALRSKAATYLLATGWLFGEADHGECGFISETGPSGWCPRRAHWEKTSPLRGPACATHARIIQRNEEAEDRALAQARANRT